MVGEHSHRHRLAWGSWAQNNLNRHENGPSRDLIMVILLHGLYGLFGLWVSSPPHLAHERGDDAVELGGLEALAGAALAQLQEVLTAQEGRGSRGEHHQSVEEGPCTERL